MFTALLSHPSVFLPDLRSMKMGEMEMDSALLTLVGSEGAEKESHRMVRPAPSSRHPGATTSIESPRGKHLPHELPPARLHAQPPALARDDQHRVRWRERTPTCAPQRAQQLRATRPRLRLARPQRRIWRGRGIRGRGRRGAQGAVPGHSARHARHTACTPGNVMSSSFSTMLSLRPPPPPIVPAAAPPPPPPVPPTRARRPRSAPRALPILGVGHLGLAHGARRSATPCVESVCAAWRINTAGRHAYVKSWRKWRKGDARRGSGAAAEECCEAHRPRGRRGVAAQGRLPVALAIVLALPVSLAPPPTTVRPVTYFSPPERPATAAALFDSLPSGASGLAASYATTRVRRAR
ncbi:hypothetical protein DFH09DRAFT_1306907 [Mycena vulgaris]|nr:hypothetical protein DFH09DRAFT_1306907 [Mycena vulgaris]